MLPAPALDKLRAALAFARSQADDPKRREVAEILAAKDEVLARFQPMFTPERIATLTAEEFRDFLLLKNNHHWDSLHRQGPAMTADMPLLRQALTLLIDETQPIASRLDTLRPSSQGAGMVSGLGRATITAILHVVGPERYGVWNNTAEGGLKALELMPELPWGSSFGARYEIVNERLHEIAAALDVDLWTLDALWWLPIVQVPDEAPEEVEAVNHVEPLEGVFGLERHLHEFLIDNWTRVPELREWDLYEVDGELVGSEYNTGAVGRIDLLARHKTDDRWLVLELKRGQTSDETVGQVLRYMSWVRRHLASTTGAVEGAIVCAAPDTKLQYALDGQPAIRCLTYQVSFALQEMAGLTL
ncbi:MAG: endonuclease NucS domain-containing protein [Planctomycetota bacterium]